MTPFTYSTKVIDTDSKDPIGFLSVRGRADGSWSINLHHWSKNSAGCDTPEACYPALLVIMAEWWLETEKRHEEGLAVIMSWPIKRPGYRPGWRGRELSKANHAHRIAAASVLKVQSTIKGIMAEAGWPTVEQL